MNRYVIVGAGAAGITAAKTIREMEQFAEIIVISKDEHVHSRCMLHKCLSGERNENTVNFVEPDFFQTHRISWLQGIEVKAVMPKSKTVRLSDGSELVYDKLLMVTGANSFIPPIGDFRTASNVLGLRNLSDVQAIAKFIKLGSNAVIVGSGLVGMDAAYGLLERHMRVTVVEMADRILPIQLDKNAGERYKRLFEKAGCEFILGKKAQKTVVDENNRVCKLILDDGTELPCDVIIVAAGVRAAVECVAESGIDAERNIRVNEYMETNISDIYGAGDVVGLSGIWPNAMKQGKIAAINMCGGRMVYEDTYAMKNTMNFFELVTLSLGRGEIKEGDEVICCEDRHCYKRAIIRDNKLDSILLQGDISYGGVYQYIIKNQIPLKGLKDRKDIFKASFAEYYSIKSDGQYEYLL